MPSTAQVKRLYAIAKDADITSKEGLRAWLASHEGWPEKETQLTSDQYDQATLELEAKKVAA